MSKPIFVATHPRACSTAFERVFMTCHDTLTCVHEPFGDAFYYGPERLSKRYEQDEKARIDSGFAESTYRTVFNRLDKDASAGKRLFIKDITHYLLPPDGKPSSIAPSLLEDQQQHDDCSSASSSFSRSKPETYPYATLPEPGNPTVVPTALLRPFHWAFLIRDPHFSIPSYYRCTIPPLDSVTGFREFYPSEAGYDELRRMFDYLRSIRHIGPVDLNGVAHPNPVSVEQDKTGTSGPSDDICVIDADDLLDYPEPVIQRFCSSVGLNYTPEMLNWNSEVNNERAAGAFEKWKGFHEDAINSTCLKPREHKKNTKTEEQFDHEWQEKYGKDGAETIRSTVDKNMSDYLYLKQFALKV